MKKRTYVELNHFLICVDKAIDEILDKAINDTDISYNFNEIGYSELSN